MEWNIIDQVIYVARTYGSYIFVFFIGKYGFSLGMCIQVVCLLYLYSILQDNTHIKIEKKTRPAWVVFPDVDKAEWTNQVIKKLWPFLQHNLGILLTDFSTDISETYLSHYYIGLEINLLNIGDRPVRLVGVKSYDISERRKVMVDLYLEYFSNSEVELLLTHSWLKVKWPMRLKSLEMKGKVRLEATLMTVNGLPAINKLSLSLVSLPIIEFDFGDIYEKLGVHLLAKYLLGFWLEENLLCPLSMDIYEDSEGLVDNTALPQGVLNLILIEARNLINADKFSFPSDVSDPYAVISFHVRTGNQNNPQIFRYQTHTIENTLNPKWDYLCQVPMEDIENISDIKINVFDSDLVTSDDILGECEISQYSVVRTARTCKERKVWKSLYLGEKAHGQVKVLVSWSPLDLRNNISNNCQGILVVYVDSCQNLSKLGNNYPYWKLRLAVGNSIKLSQAVQMSSNPAFCERFVFLVECPEKDWFKFEIFNMKNEKSGGNLQMKISDIWRDNLTLSTFITRELVTKSPQGQRKDPKLVFSCEFKKLLHSAEIIHKLNFALPSNNSVRRAWKKANTKIFGPNNLNLGELNKHMFKEQGIQEVRETSLESRKSIDRSKKMIQGGNHSKRSITSVAGGAIATKTKKKETHFTERERTTKEEIHEEVKYLFFAPQSFFFL